MGEFISLENMLLGVFFYSEYTHSLFVYNEYTYASIYVNKKIYMRIDAYKKYICTRILCTFIEKEERRL